jgi:hypothetical protein
LILLTMAAGLWAWLLAAVVPTSAPAATVAAPRLHAAAQVDRAAAISTGPAATGPAASHTATAVDRTIAGQAGRAGQVLAATPARSTTTATPQAVAIAGAPAARSAGTSPVVAGPRAPPVAS